MNKNIIILHDVDGRIYFDGIKKLYNDEKLDDIKYFESIVIKRLIKSLLLKKISINVLRVFLKNFIFRLKVPFIQNQVILLGMAPYNIRFLWYGLLARKNKVIYHTSWPYWWTENVPCKLPFLNGILKKIFIFYFNNFNFYYCGISEQSTNSLSNCINKKDLIFTIPHAVDLSIFKREVECSRDNNIVEIVFVGRMVKEKGILELIELVKRCSKRYNFTFVGDGELLDVLVKQVGGYDNVKIKGRINDKMEIAKLMAKSDIFILPSRKVDGWEELFGISIIEAMASSLVVISTNHVGPKEIITHNKNGFILSDDDELVENIYKLVDGIDLNSDSIINMRKLAVNRANDYSIDNVSIMWSKLLDNIQTK